MTEMRFVGRKTELTTLCEALRDGESVVVIGGRRAGKTWLVNELTTEMIGRSTFFVSGDQLSFVDERNALRKLAKALGLTWDSSWDEFSGREEIAEHLAKQGPLALIIDETDRLLNYDWSGRFLAWLRGLVEPSGLGRMLAVVAVGGPILNDYRNPHDRGSPVLNLARRLCLDPLDDDALRELLVGHPAGVSVDELIDAAGGQPLLAQTYLRGRIKTADHGATVQWMIDECRHHLSVWREQLGPDGLRFIAGLDAEGRALDGSLRSSPACSKARYLCLVRLHAGMVKRGPIDVVAEILAAAQTRYDVALAYSNEDNEIAKSVFWSLSKRGCSVFFAEMEADWLTGPDPHPVLPNLFNQRAGTVLILGTHTYLTKHWSLTEFGHARSSCERVMLWSVDGLAMEDWPRNEICIDGDLATVVTELLGSSAVWSDDSTETSAFRHLSTQLAQFADEILSALERIEDTTKTFGDLSEDELGAFRQLGALATEYLQIRVLDDQRQATLTIGQKTVKAVYEDKIPKWLRLVIGDLQQARSSNRGEP